MGGLLAPSVSQASLLASVRVGFESEKAMYDITPEQSAAEQTLSAQGFKFSNWIDAQDGVESHGCMVYVKRGATRHGREYREIAPDGSIN